MTVHKSVAVAAWHEIGGKRSYYRSKAEANYARFLEWQKTTGQITDWEHEPKEFWYEAIRRGVRSYKPDFSVTLLDGRVEWREVKGYMDSKSRTKIKRFAKYYPTETLVVIDSKTLRQMANTVAKVVPGWE